ncbi:hypothetical protein Bca52824_019347 [Brassica carinata]|uniref:Cupin type-1 domain-containing protein n=1 Tax=Brassica carinata TaxID=52824 RepID=A0A8X8AYF9_BRACI|nr:hypothetical protein Bca52824_019347 [Brassica carinata]
MEDVRRIPGLNTLAIAIARYDFAPGGQIPPHIHPRASQMILVLKGKLLFHANIGKTNAVAIGANGSQDPGVVPIGKTLFGSNPLIDTGLLAKAFALDVNTFHANIGKTNAVAIGANGSQDPGVVPIGKTLFGSNPLIDTGLLAKAFALDVNTVRYLQRVFSPEDYILN